MYSYGNVRKRSTINGGDHQYGTFVTLDDSFSLGLGVVIICIYMVLERNLKKAQLDKRVYDLSGYEVEESMFLQKSKEWNVELVDETQAFM